MSDDLVYSYGIEDWRTEAQALQIQEDDHVLSITGSGDRPLNLLLSNCAKITCIDSNPMQSQLLHLKRASLKSLDTFSFQEFMGVTDNQKVKRMPRKVYEALNHDSQDFWVKKMSLIEKGIIYQGELEKAASACQTYGRLMRSGTIKALLAMTNLDEQREYVAKYWDRPLWRDFFSLAFDSKLSPLIDQASPNLHIGEHIFERLTSSLSHHLASDIPLFTLMFDGSVHSLSPYLLPLHSSHLKRNLYKLDIQTEEIITYLQSQPDESIDCFSLSDIATNMSEQEYNDLLREVYRCAKPGARLCTRQFLTQYKIDPPIAHLFTRDHALETKLELEERGHLYRFTIAKIEKGNSNVPPLDQAA